MALGRWQATIVDEAGNVLPGAQVTVRRETVGAPLAVLYSDRDGLVPLGNPFPAGGDGFGAFHVVGGAYRIDAVSGTNTRTWRYVGVGTASEFDADSFVLLANARERLSANRTYYVRSDGSDANAGLVNSSGGAFLTVQKAIDVVYGTLDLAGFDVDIQLGTGTFARAVVTAPQVGKGTIAIRGDAATPANVIMTATGIGEFAGVVDVRKGATITVKDLALNTVTSGSCLYAERQGVILFNNLRFGACSHNHILANKKGYIQNLGDYSINGSAVAHAFSTEDSQVAIQSATVTLSGTPAFSGAFVKTDAMGLAVVTSDTWSGSATGSRFNAIRQSYIYATGSVTQFPGNAAGTIASGGEHTFLPGSIIASADALTLPYIDVASAGTVDLGAVASDKVRITGTTTITSFGTAAAGVRRKVRFAGALTLTYNATSLIIPTAASIATAADDTLEAQSLGGGNWFVCSYHRASGAAVSGGASGGISTIASGSFAAANSQVIATSIPTNYAYLMLVIAGVSSNTATRLVFVQPSFDNGASYDTVAANYIGFREDGGSVGALATASFVYDPASTAAQTRTHTLKLCGYQAGPFTMFSSAGVGGSGTPLVTDGMHANTNAINALRVIWDNTGNFDAGTYALYGIS